MVDAAGRIPIGDAETIAFYGDSITEQNLYTAYVETYLLSRLPGKRLLFYNFGWGGDTAPGGRARFERDVAPVSPTTVFVNFGMNDGGYVLPDRTIHERYVKGQRDLAAAIRRCGAREVLLTTSPVDYDIQPVYNETLSRFADAVIALGEELGLPVVDIFHPMSESQRRAKAREPRFTMIPDGVHPDPVGHLVMAYCILRRLDVPGSLGEIEISRGKASARGALRLDGFGSADSRIEFDLALPFIPFYVPPEARKALELVPFQDELNLFRLKIADWDPSVRCQLTIDGKEAATFTAEALARGVDLALVDGAGWAAQGRALWQMAQYRWRKHFEAWREMALGTDGFLKGLGSFAALQKAQAEFVRELGPAMAELVRPRTYRVCLAETNVLDLWGLELSPLYPFDNDFASRRPPELNAEAVAWKAVRFENHVMDLAKLLGNPTNCVVYGRAFLEAESDCKLHLTLGSDDGIEVFVNGRSILARNVMRPLNLGDDEAMAELSRGRNTLLFKVTQGVGGYALAVKARVYGRARVRQLDAAR